MLGGGWTAAKLDLPAKGIAAASSLDGEGKGLGIIYPGRESVC